MKNPIALGVDIGGSHITAALINLETREIISSSFKRQMVNSQEEAEKIIADWCAVISESFSNINSPSRRIGIAMPGPFDYENGISLMHDQDKFNSLYKLNIKERLSSCLGVPRENIRFTNDAVSFLLGEVFCGSVRGYNRVLGLTLGTGLGSAIYINHNAEDADLWNSDFKEGIAEDYMSGRWFVKRYAELTGNMVKGVKELLQVSDSKHYIKQIFSEFAENLAAFISPLVKKYDMEAVVIGGNISNAFELFLPELKVFLDKNQIKAVLKIASLKEDASLVGAVSFWEDSYLQPM